MRTCVRLETDVHESDPDMIGSIHFAEAPSHVWLSSSWISVHTQCHRAFGQGKWIVHVVRLLSTARPRAM